MLNYSIVELRNVKALLQICTKVRLFGFFNYLCVKCCRFWFLKEIRIRTATFNYALVIE